MRAPKREYSYSFFAILLRLIGAATCIISAIPLFIDFTRFLAGRPNDFAGTYCAAIGGLALFGIGKITAIVYRIRQDIAYQLEEADARADASHVDRVSEP